MIHPSSSDIHGQSPRPEIQREKQLNCLRKVRPVNKELTKHSDSFPMIRFRESGGGGVVLGRQVLPAHQGLFYRHECWGGEMNIIDTTIFHHDPQTKRSLCKICQTWMSYGTKNVSQHVHGKKHQKLLKVSRAGSVCTPRTEEGGGDKKVSTKKQQHHHLSYQSPIPPKSSAKLQPWRPAHEVSFLCDVPSDSDEDKDEEWQDEKEQCGEQSYSDDEEESEEEKVQCGDRESHHGDDLLCDAFGSLAVNNSNSNSNNNALASTKEVNVENVAVKKFKTPSNHPHKNKKRSFSHFTLDLMVGLDKLDDAVSLHNACCKEGSMMRYVINKVVGYKLLSEQYVHTPLQKNVANSCMVMIKNNAPITGQFSIVLDYIAGRTMTMYQIKKIVSIFDSYNSIGFLDWLSGERGWKFYNPPSDTAGSNTVWKKRIVTKLNILQGVHSLFAPITQKYFFGSSGRMVWRKQNELTDVVNDVRVWIETITPKTDLIRQMLRNSSFGPNSLVHWAHHHPHADFPLTVVSEVSMLMLVDGLIKLFQKEFHDSSSSLGLGTRWRNHQKRRSTDFDLAVELCPEWTVDYLEQRLNSSDY
jgi:hypothetical protein